MGMTHGFADGSATPMTLALTFGANRLYLVGQQEAPLWLRRRRLRWRPVTVAWKRLDQLPGHWWAGQCGRDFVVLGQGARPALTMQKSGTSWRALLPKGRQSVRIVLPDSACYEVRPVLPLTRSVSPL